MYLLLIFLPFIGSCLSGLFGRYLGSQGSSILTVSCLLFSLILSLVCFYETALANSFVYIKLAEWINSESLNVDWGFMFDSLTILMCVVVTFISFLVHLYSVEYMHNDPHLSRFMSYLSLFTFFMLLLVTADNLLQMFIGWEGVGLCSYLLINFWFTRIQANKAAIKAMIVNRVGDFAILIGIFLIFINYKTLEYSTLASMTPFFIQTKIEFLNFTFDLLTVITVCLFIGAIGKSAQLGLHTWLPDAMEGPTPVSALIHAATMVTAGIFLITRTSFLFEFSINTLEAIILIGSVTAFFASTTGLVQNDLKKVIAYSTCSQLGYMVFSCGLSSYTISIFHLSNHAFFKALLFLGAGSVIHAINDEQDMRKMGGLKKLLPITYSTILIGSLALAGFPYLSGFYSKDLILEISVAKFSMTGYFSYYLGVSSAFFTAFYSTRLIYLTFLSKPLGHRIIISYAKESTSKILVPLVCLVIPSIFIGYVSKDLIVGVGNSTFSNTVFVKIGNLDIFDAEFGLSSFHKWLPLFLSLIGIGTAFFFFKAEPLIIYDIKRSKTGKRIYHFLNRKWFFDKIYNEFISQNFFKFGYSTSYKYIDRGVLEILGPTGLSFSTNRLSYYLNKINSGSIYHYNLVVMTSITYILVLMLVTRVWSIDFSIQFDDVTEHLKLDRYGNPYDNITRTIENLQFFRYGPLGYLYNNVKVYIYNPVSFEWYVIIDSAIPVILFFYILILIRYNEEYSNYTIRNN